MKNFFLIFLSISLVAFSFVGCSDSSTMNPVSADNSVTNSLEKRPGNGQTIVGIAASDTNFTYLVAAVQFAGLVDVLNGNRQFTVFAPVNQAFLDLAAALNISIEELLTEPYRELVTTVLLYHVSPGLKFSRNVAKSSRVNTLQGQFAFTKVEDGVVMIGNDVTGYANITAVDIRATNGVIHVLDKVIIPVLD
ncbi:MAG TPA: fasciclin domain-containing protein [Ignavibacteriaceae bacterium]|nr:fasciclin domain-containing protein [Ignavibacteriaceae bacterium]